MKRNIILFALALIFFCACEEVIETPKGDLIISSTEVKLGEPVSFEITGEPQTIVFFSGEEGCQYELRVQGPEEPGDKGKVVKAMNERNKPYKYIYQHAGEYQATFIVTNYDYNDKKIKQVVLETSVLVVK